MDFSKYRQFIVENVDCKPLPRHVFIRVPDAQIREVEGKLPFDFPNELRDFYQQIGYGFLCNNLSYNTNRIMHPGDVYDFLEGLDMYKGDSRRELFIEEGFMPFFEVSENSMLTIRLGPDPDEGAIFFFDEKIADSLHDFLYEMDRKPDYYLDLL